MNVVFIEITAMVHGVITVRLATRSGNKSKAKVSLFVFMIIQPMHSYIAPTSWTLVKSNIH